MPDFLKTLLNLISYAVIMRQRDIQNIFSFICNNFIFKIHESLIFKKCKICSKYTLLREFFWMQIHMQLSRRRELHTIFFAFLWQTFYPKMYKILILQKNVWYVLNAQFP